MNSQRQELEQMQDDVTAGVLSEEEFIDRLQAAIAAAVQAEREANCAAMCRNCAAGLKAVMGDLTTWNGRYVHFLPDEQRYVGCGANAIRARNGAGK